MVDRELPIPKIPIDLIGIGVLVAVMGTVVLPLDVSPVIESPLGLVFLLFVPGYVLLAILFPARSAQDGGASPRLTGTERLVLSFVASVGIAVLAGLGLGATTWRMNALTMYGVLAAMTMPGLAVAYQRRRRLPPDDRLDRGVAETLHRTARTLTQASGPVERTLNVALAAMVILALPVLGMAVETGGDDGITEMSLRSEAPTGEFIAGAYPQTFEGDEAHRFALSVGNFEGEPTEHTVVVALQRMNSTGAIVEEVEVDRFDLALADGEEGVVIHEVTPGEIVQGENVRLVYLLYRGDAPADPTIESAYRHLHLWFEIDDSQGRDES